MKIEMEVSEEAIKHIIQHMENESDDCYIPGIPYPPSDNWTEFLQALKAAKRLDK